MFQFFIKKSNCYTLVDKYIYNKYKDRAFTLIGGYPCIRVSVKSKRRWHKLHRLVMKIKDPKIWVDHINGNILDNRKLNLRIVTVKQSSRNRGVNKNKKYSSFKGIYWLKIKKRWRVMITLNYKRIHIGTYKLEEEAAKAYDDAAKKYHGEFARLNFPKEKYNNAKR